MTKHPQHFVLTAQDPTASFIKRVFELRKLKRIKAWRSQLEVAPESGRFHHQCTFATTRKETMKTVRAWFRGMHIETCMEPDTSWAYCSKPESAFVCLTPEQQIAALDAAPNRIPWTKAFDGNEPPEFQIEDIFSGEWRCHQAQLCQVALYVRVCLPAQLGVT